MAKSERIVFYMNILRDGAGMINREIGFSRQLHEAGYNVSVISHFKPVRPSPDPDIPLHCIWRTRYLSLLYSNVLFFPMTFILLCIHFLVLRPDVVFVDLYREGWWALLLRPVFRYKIIFTYHGVADGRFYGGEKGRELENERRLTHTVLQKVDQVIIVSDFMRGEIEKIGIEATTVYNGVEKASRYQDTESAFDNCLAVFVGRYTEYKGALNLIKAFADVHKEVPQARLKMYGVFESSEYVELMKECIADNDLCDVVDISDEIEGSQFADTVGGATIFVNGSVDETFGMPLLEAQALGVPCVAFRAGGIPEVVRDGVTGLLADQGRIDKYAECVKRILSDAELRRKMSDQAVLHANEFLYSELVSKVIEVINKSTS